MIVILNLILKENVVEETNILSNENMDNSDCIVSNNIVGKQINNQSLADDTNAMNFLELKIWYDLK